jgi:hypothetical protein
MGRIWLIKAVFKKIADHTNARKIYPGLNFEGGATTINPENIPGLSDLLVTLEEAGWMPNAEHM